MQSSQVPEGGAVAIEIAGWPLLVSRSGGRVHAVLNRCSHAAAAFLPGGRVRQGMVMCPAHGARFALADGRCIGGAYRPIRTFPCDETDGRIVVRVPDHPPGPDETPVKR